MKWMECITCKRTVKVNSTGTCLACQQGFSNQSFGDEYKDNYQEIIDDLKQRQKKVEDAIEKGIQPEDDKQEY